MLMLAWSLELELVARARASKYRMVAWTKIS